jgi:hypothetical protein
MAEEISAIQMSEKFQRLTYVNKISCRNREESGSSSDEDMEERKKKKSKDSKRDQNIPHSLSQKQNTKGTVNTEHGNNQQRSKLQSAQTD